MKFLIAHPHIAVFFMAFIICDLLTPVLNWMAKRAGVVDIPNKRKIHTEPVPRLGGMALFFSFVLSIVFTLDENPQLYSMLFAAAFVFFTGFFDDIFHLKATVKLAVLLAVSVFLVSRGVHLHLFKSQPVNFILTFIFLAYMASAFNAIDNMDGLSAGTAFVCAFAFYVISFQKELETMGYLAVALAGSCLGFLRYNFFPARVFMGDSGAYFLGFVLGAVAIMGEWGNPREPVKAIFVPALLLWFPLWDLLLTTYLRIKNKKVRSVREAVSMSAKDHVSHRLMLLFSLSHRETVLLLHLSGLLFGSVGIAIREISLAAAFVVISFLTLVMVYLSFLLNKAPVSYEE